MKHAVFGALIFCTALHGAQAQSLRDLETSARNDTRTMASVTIPFGANSRSREATPRVDFAFETQKTAQSHSVTPLRIDPDYQRQSLRAATISFTLEQNPRLLLNDQRVATFGPRLTADEDEEKDGGGIGAAWVFIGLGALVGTGVLAAELLEDDLEDPFRVGN